MATAPEAPALSADDLALVADNSLAEHATPAGDALAALEESNRPLHDEVAAPVPAKGAAPLKAEAHDGETAEAAAEDDNSAGDAAADESPKPKAKGGAQKRIDELTKDKRGLERRVAELEAAKPTPEPKAEAPEAPKELKPEDFETYEQYLDARADARAAKVAADTLKKADDERTKRETEASQRDANAKRTTEWNGRVEQARERYEDFDAVAFNPELQIPAHVTDVIVQDEQGPHLAYYLGSHPEEAARIAALPPLLAAREIGRLSATLSLPKPRTSTGAPAPVPTVGTREIKVLTPDTATNMADYRASRQAKKRA